MNEERDFKEYIKKSIAAGETLQKSDELLPHLKSFRGKIGIQSVAASDDGAIEILFGFFGGCEYYKKDYYGMTLIFRPMIVDGSRVEWDCLGGTLGKRYRPSKCGGLD